MILDPWLTVSGYVGMMYSHIRSLTPQSLQNACSQSEIDGCASLGDAIQTCQKNGKLVTVSIGGADSSITLSSDADAQSFGETIYNLFLGGKGQDRPFGDGVVLDG